MRRPAAWIVAAGITLAGVSAGYAQEVQVPLDQQGRLDQIDADLARRLGVLVDRFPDLVEARLFVRADDATIFFLEVVERRRGQLVRERVPMTPEEVARFRQHVSARLAERAPHVGLDQSGRTSLLIGTTTLGLSFYGWAVPAVFRVESGAAYASIYLFTAAAGYLVPTMATRGRPVSGAMARLALHGASRGIWRGQMLYQAMAGYTGSGRDRIRASLLMSLGEGLAGYTWAARTRMSPGAAYSITNGSDFGMLGGFWAAGLIDPSREDPGRLVPTLLLTGAAVGIPLTYYLARRSEYSHGDAHVIRTGTALSILTGMAVLIGMEADDGNLLAATGLVTTVGGLLLGDRFVRDTRFSLGQGNMIRLASMAGGAMGLGVAYLTGVRGSWHPVMTAGGAVAGFATTFRSYAREGRVFHNVSLGQIEVDLMPAGLLGLPAPSRHTPSVPPPPPPVVRIGWRLP